VKPSFLLNHGGDCRFLDLDRGVLIGEDNKRQAAMAMKDGFPLFLSQRFEGPEQPEPPGIGKAWDDPVVSSRLLKTGIFGGAAAAIVFAVLAAGNPLALFAGATAFLVGTPAPQDDTGTSTPIIQSTAGAEALPPIANGAPTREDIAAALKAADQRQAQIDQPPAEALLNQFRDWAAEQDARTDVQPAQPVQDIQSQPEQDAPAPLAQNTPAQIQPVHRHRQVRRMQNARAEIRAEQDHRVRTLRRENARGQGQPQQDPQAQGQPVQFFQPPSFLQSLGFRN
jgi:hypothetical protein